MAYISDLAKELNRTEGMVTKMLKTRGYLKENGMPRKATVDAGLMREDGFIYKKGWNQFVDELGYKSSVNNKDKKDDDIVSMLRQKGYKEITIEWVRNENFQQDDDDVFCLCNAFEKIFNEAVKRGNTEDISCRYARLRMITDDIGFDYLNSKLKTCPTSLALGHNISDENWYSDLSNWLEAKYKANVLYINKDDNTIYFEYDFNYEDIIYEGLIYEGSIDWLEEKLEVENYYLPTDKEKLGL